LVLSFHGFLLNPDTQAVITRWHELADLEGFLVAYPQGTGWPRRWNSGETWGAVDISDTGFLRDMIDDVAGLAAVDRTRVYANGFSNGGGISVYIGCNAADMVAAIGSVAGAVVSKEECQPDRPVPVMAFHGTEDWIVPYQGGPMEVAPLRLAAGIVDGPSEFVAAQDWAAAFAGLNGCDPLPEAIPPVEDVVGQRYRNCDDGAQVILYTIDGGGHQWPGGGTIPGAGHNTMAIDATQEMWSFFEGYRLGD
jgi:polyhydroxybutyrate depolymerase